MAKQKTKDIKYDAIAAAKEKAQLMSQMSETTHKTGPVEHSLLLSIKDLKLHFETVRGPVQEQLMASILIW